MMKKLHLELGGKDPMVIAPDAEMDMAVSGLAYAALINTGQVCTSTERVYVHESIINKFVSYSSIEVYSSIFTLEKPTGVKQLDDTDKPLLNSDLIK